MASTRALIIGGAVIGLVAAPIPLYVAMLSLVCACGQCANPLPAFLLFPLPMAAYFCLSSIPGISAVAPVLLLLLSIAQCAAYGAALVAARLGVIPRRGPLVFVGVHIAVSIVVVSALGLVEVAR